MWYVSFRMIWMWGEAGRELNNLFCLYPYPERHFPVKQVHLQIQKHIFSKQNDVEESIIIKETIILLNYLLF